jgi:glycine cleavage system H protein
VRLYTKDHTWIVVEGTRARVGISDFAQKELGDIAYVDLPTEGRVVQRGDVACTVDSLKSSSEIYAPVSGTIVTANSILSADDKCGLINSDPLGEGWLFEVEMSAPHELELLLAETDYNAYIGGGD